VACSGINKRYFIVKFEWLLWIIFLTIFVFIYKAPIRAFVRRTNKFFGILYLF